MRDPDLPALELLTRVLGATASAKLPSALVRDWNLALAVQSGLDVRREGSLFWTFIALRDGADTTTVERIVRETMAGVARDGVSAEALDAVRRPMLTSERFALQGVRARAQAITAAEVLLGDATLAGRRLEALERVTPADLQRVAQRVLGGAPHAVVLLDPAPVAGGMNR
jgi:zinc protease